MVAMVVSFVVWSMISPVAPQLTKLYHLSDMQKSLLVATPVLLGSLLRIPMGAITDRFGGRRTYTLLMLYLVIPLIGISFAHSFGQLIFWEVLLGVAGTSFAVGIGHVSKWYPPQEQGLILGITALGNLGTAVAGFTIPTLYLNLGFSSTARLLVIPVLVMAACLWFFTRDPKRATEERPSKATGSPAGASVSANASAKTEQPSNNRSIWTNVHLWVLAFFYFITFGGFMAFGNYLPTLLQSQFHLNPVDAGLRASGFVLLATALRPIGGYLADKTSPSRLLVLVFTVITIAALVFAYGLNNIVLTTIAALVIALMLGIGNGTVFKLVPYHFPQATGKATGLVGALGGVGGFFPPLVMGALKQATGSYAVGMVLLAAASALALWIAWMQNRTNRETPPTASGQRGVRVSA
ncbi:MAG: MFS transporter [Alicyclobacillus sp.]|nr:MFS transporter [Alicyclobacillus sp.]